jgi:hypothetical protein
MGNDVSNWIEEGIQIDDTPDTHDTHDKDDINDTHDKDKNVLDKRNKLIEYMKQNSNIQINENISIRIGKDEKEYLFYKTKKMKKPKFYSIPNEYMDLDDSEKINKIKEYVQKKYKLIC